MAAFDFTGILISASYARVIQYASGAFYDGTGSAAPVVKGSGIIQLTVGTIQPVGPTVGDLWVDTN